MTAAKGHRRRHAAPAGWTCSASKGSVIDGSGDKLAPVTAHRTGGDAMEGMVGHTDREVLARKPLRT